MGCDCRRPLKGSTPSSLYDGTPNLSSEIFVTQYALYLKVPSVAKNMWTDGISAEVVI